MTNKYFLRNFIPLFALVRRKTGIGILCLYNFYQYPLNFK